jgi:type II secretory pathway pseudopilin PulG
MPSIKGNYRGDTIIEVMFAMAIIGVVLAAAYATASRNLQTSQFAKERTQASKIAEGQLEQLKTLADLDVITQETFCLDLLQSSPVIGTDVDAPVDECVEGFYEKSITKNGADYTVVVSWIPPGGSESNKANVTFYYSDYDFDLSTSLRLGIFTVSSGNTSAILGARVLNGEGVQRRGIIYGPVGSELIVENNGLNGIVSIENSGTTTTYEQPISGLTAGVEYIARSWVLTSTGYQYSSTIEIRTSPAATPIISSLTSTPFNSSVSISGNIDSNGSSVLSRVVTLFRTSNPAATRSFDVDSDSFSLTVDLLLPNTEYSFRLTTSNQLGSTESELQTFRTREINVPNSTNLGEFNGSSYYFISDLVSWTEARARAEALGGHLVTFSSAAENSYVSSRFPQTSWIGLTDERIEDNWEWVTGEPYSYSSWSPLEPNNFQWTPAGQDYALTNWASGSGRWDDQSNDGRHGFVVEFDSDLVASLPTVTNGVVSNINTTGALVSGAVVSSIKSQVSERGVVYGTSVNPTISDFKIVSGQGIGSFNAAISGLKPNRTYYARAYAINAVGTAYAPTSLTFRTTALSTGYIFRGSFNGSDYYLSTARVLWSEARTRAENLGGHLVTITSRAENDFVESIALPYSAGGTWIGLEDLDDNNVWQWVTGESTNGFFNWASGGVCGSQPEKNPYFIGGARQLVAEINMGLSSVPAYANCEGFWNDEDTTFSNRFIVEFD